MRLIGEKNTTRMKTIPMQHLIITEIFKKIKITLTKNGQTSIALFMEFGERNSTKPKQYPCCCIDRTNILAESQHVIFRQVEPSRRQWVCNVIRTNPIISDLDTSFLDWSKLLELCLKLRNRKVKGQVSNINGVSFNCKWKVVT